MTRRLFLRLVAALTALPAALRRTPAAATATPTPQPPRWRLHSTFVQFFTDPGMTPAAIRFAQPLTHRLTRQRFVADAPLPLSALPPEPDAAPYLRLHTHWTMPLPSPGRRGWWVVREVLDAEPPPLMSAAVLPPGPAATR